MDVSSCGCRRDSADAGLPRDDEHADTADRGQCRYRQQRDREASARFLDETHERDRSTTDQVRDYVDARQAGYVNRRLYTLQDADRSARRGPWADAQPVAPWEWRKAERLRTEGLRSP